MNTNNNKSYLFLMGISILFLCVFIFSGSYAYFKARIEGEGTPISLTAGNVKLSISESKIDASNIAPIYDSTKETKAKTNAFTISSTNDSNLDACYSLFLVVDNIGANLRNSWFKYELVYSDGTISGDFGNVTYSEDGTATIGLLTNQELNSFVTSNSYTLRVWLSYDTENDQTSILTGDVASRTFNAHLYVVGQEGTCNLGY